MEKSVRIAVICPNNVEDMELIVPIDIWRRAKFMVDVIIYDTKHNVSLGYSTLKVTSPFSIKETNLIQYDAIYMPGGPGSKSYLATSIIEKEEPESRLHSSIKRFYDDPEKWLIALCAAPVYLLCILEQERNQDIKFTCYNDNELIGDFKKNWVNKKVEVDLNKKIISGQNAGCCLDIALATVELLGSKELADSIAKRLFIDYRGYNAYQSLG